MTTTSSTHPPSIISIWPFCIASFSVNESTRLWVCDCDHTEPRAQEWKPLLRSSVCCTEEKHPTPGHVSVINTNSQKLSSSSCAQRGHWTQGLKPFHFPSTVPSSGQEFFCKTRKILYSFRWRYFWSPSNYIYTPTRSPLAGLPTGDTMWYRYGGGGDWKMGFWGKWPGSWQVSHFSTVCPFGIFHGQQIILMIFSGLERYNRGR